ncbi:MAG: RsmD family RNA methyltransferase [Chitinophagaceae bacterium]|nr:RsmD family RNA methyltransferase [Chitinophagaceae bacterium]
MRIIGGEYGGRRVNPPSKMPYTRPTTDIAKEGLFNILQNNIELENLKTLDLFGGTGSISYELASRGATHLTVVEKDPNMAEFIKKTGLDLKIGNLKVVKMDAFRFMEQCTDTFGFIFAGPPYALEAINDIPIIISEKNLLKQSGWFVLEHTPRNHYEGYPLFVTTRAYGTTLFSIFVNK